MSSNKVKDYSNISLLNGQYLSHPSSGEEVVISGISGMFPDSKNVKEFMSNLFNKVNMVTPTHRWLTRHPEMPKATGTIPEIDKFDAGFFGEHYNQAHYIDPLQRMMLEKSIEALLDAGLHPFDLEGTKTGVFVGACYSDFEKYCCLDNPSMYSFIGGVRSMICNKISTFLKLKGPSYVTDTACSSSLYAFEHAYRTIRSGIVDVAIVAGCNVCSHPSTTLQFSRLGVLAPDGRCKSFDKNGDGYVRAESACVVILQLSKDAKRNYAQVVHAKTNCDGFKDGGISFPSHKDQKQLLTDFYQECGINPNSLAYLEAHGTGTFVGDPEECAAIDEVFTKGKSKPLYIGSVKSNIGHSEAGSGLSSIIKSVIALHTGFIPPNINFQEAREEITGVIEGRLKVVTEKTPLPNSSGLIGVNSFGFGGANCHVLLRKNPKQKSNTICLDNLPRLVCCSGRTENGLKKLLDEFKASKFDPEQIYLLHEAFKKNIPNHLYRGYTIITPAGEVCTYTSYYSQVQTPLYLVFGELTNWFDIGSKLLCFPAFKQTLQKIQKSIPIDDININKILLSNNIETYETYKILCSIAVQIGIIELIRLVEIQPFHIFGYSYGELTAAYMDGILSLDETVNCALVFNDASRRARKVEGGSKSQEMTFNIDNSDNFKSNHINEIKSNIFRNLSNIIKQPRVWKIANKTEKYASPEYFLKSFFKTFNGFNLDSITDNSLLLQIGQVPLLETNDKVKVISLFPLEKKKHLENFLTYLGNLYCNGYNAQLYKLYPKVSLPVSNSTEMISPYIEWCHTKKWAISEYNLEILRNAKSGTRNVRIIHNDKAWSYINGHVIDGRNLFPAMGYLFLAWQSLAVIKEIPIEKLNVDFEDCKFLRATTMPKKGAVQFNIIIQKTGNFEIFESDSSVVTGKMTHIEDNNHSAIKNLTVSNKRKAHMSMKTKDIYKELRLRGYNYKKGFRGIRQCNIEATEADIKWDNNWVTFMDNMLQMLILKNDTRLLYVPIYLSKLTIAATKHVEWLKTISAEDGNIDIRVIRDPCGDEISSGFIKIKGLIASSIAKRKDLGVPVFEKHVFIPNCTSLTIDESVRVNTQIILENALVYKFKAVEVVDDHTNDGELLAPILKSVLEDQPLITLQMLILSDKQIDTSFTVEQKKLSTETDCMLVIVSKLLVRQDEYLQEVLNAVAENCFVISREKLDILMPESIRGFSIITEHKSSTETFVLLRKSKNLEKAHFITITNGPSFNWIQEIQDRIKANNNQNVVIKSENEPTNGILGFVNCLRREPESSYFRCLFVMDNNQDIDCDKQLNKNMAVNVYKNGTWGTYRHLLINQSLMKQNEHSYVLSTVRGDLSSLSWLEGPLNHDTKPKSETTMVYVNYSSINFRDVMIASGRINVDVVTMDRLEQEAIQGFEFAGIDEHGRRVCGMSTCFGLATMVRADKYFLLDIPDNMTIQEAATIPVVYGTVLYAFIIKGHLKKGESILIHSGTGGIGQAAIRIALGYGCTVFTTVGNKEKKEFLLNIFPQLKESHIGNSRDLSFEQMIYRETNGKGVDIVLNSLAEEKLLASVRCLGKRGRFLEIGKFDLGNNNDLNMLLLKKEAVFHGIMVDKLFTETPEIKCNLMSLLREHVNNKMIQPLNSNVFKYNEIEQAFRFMASGKHTGKVLIEIKPEDKNNLKDSSPYLYPCQARYICDEDKTYIIVGGLGGFGLELTDWLVLRGARKIVLTSRRGIVTGYQKYRINIWQSYGIKIFISQADIKTEKGCEKLLNEAMNIGPVDAIFNLAVVLADSIFENQTPQTFLTSFEPKAFATHYLDTCSRKLCPNLRDFVIFSSVSCGRGNAGQTNYGMANSVMERICEKRREEGYPAVAIQWGAIGDVGLVAEMQEEHVELEIGGTLQQKISSCLNALDILLKQNEAAIVSSMVVAEKRNNRDLADNIIDAVLIILGIDDAKNVSAHATFAELGMDSMVAVEIKQTLEREYEVFLTPKEIRTLTLAKLREIQQRDNDNKTTNEAKKENDFDMNILFGTLPTNRKPTQSLVLLNSIPEARNQILLFPGIEGSSFALETLAKNLEANVYSLQYPYKICAEKIQDFTNHLMPLVLQTMSKTVPFKFIAHSFGCLIALEVAHILEEKGYNGSIFLIESSPDLIKSLALATKNQYKEDWETFLVISLLSLYLPQEEITKHQEKIKNCSCWKERVDLGVEMVKHQSISDADHHREAANGIYEKLKLTLSYKPTFNKLKSKLHLVRASAMEFLGLTEDYGLSQLTEQPIKIDVLEGDHHSVLDNDSLMVLVNSWICKQN